MENLNYSDIKQIPIKALTEIELFDIVILKHGLEDYNRDYYFIIESGTKQNQGTFKILFTHCFYFDYQHKFLDINYPELIRKSWNDDLISADLPKEPDGYWWANAFTHAYPGFTYDPDNKKAKEFSQITEKPMYAINLETENYIINLIFHNFKYEFLESGTPISDQVIVPVKDFKFKS